MCSLLCRRSAVGGKTSNGEETYRTVSVYRSVDCCNERSMENYAAKLNVEGRMALLQKEEIENRKKILEGERRNKVKIECCSSGLLARRQK
jgi:hypothetical protein